MRVYLTRFKVDLTKMKQVIVDDKTFYVFMPISKFSDLLINFRGETFVYYHFKGLNVKDFGEHNLGSMMCQCLCGHKLYRFHASCLTCGYRKAFLGKIPKIVPIKMLYQVFIPSNVRLEKLKDIVRKKLLTLVEMTCS